MMLNKITNRTRVRRKGSSIVAQSWPHNLPTPRLRKTSQNPIDDQPLLFRNELIKFIDRNNLS